MSEAELKVDIPNKADWPIESIDNLCSLISRGTAPVYVEHSEVLAIGQRCVASTGFAPDFARPHSHRAMRNVLRPVCGDVLLNSTGTGTIGRSVVFNSPGNFIIDGHVTVMRPRAELADSRWLNSVLRTPSLQRHLERFCFAGSTNQLELSRTPLRVTRFPTPHIDEQRAMGLVIDSLDTAICQTEAIIGKLKAVKQGLLHDLLTRGIDVNGEMRPPQIEAPHLYKKSPLGWIPKDWEVKRVIELLAAVDPAMRSGPFGSALLKHELVSAGLPFLGIDNVHAERFVADYKRFVTHKKFAELVRYAVRPNDLMITIMGTVGRCCLVPEDVGPALSSKHIWTITLDQALYSPYLAMLQVNYSPWVLKHFGKDQQGGTMAAIRSETLRSTLLPTPPREEQRLMEERLRVISKRIDLEVDSLVKMQAKKSGLMDDLLTGQVRVTNILPFGAGTSHTDPHSLLLELCQALHQADQRAKDEYKRELFGDAFVPELLIMRKDKVRVEIRKENVSHNAPHLHISHSDKFDASISLKDFSILAGDIDRKVFKHFVKKLAPLKMELMQIWNELNEKENSMGAEVLISNLKF